MLQKSWFAFAADAMVDIGLAKLGYDYINIGTLLRFIVLLFRPSWILVYFLVEKDIWELNICETADDCWAAYDRDSQVCTNIKPIYVEKQNLAFCR